VQNQLHARVCKRRSRGMRGPCRADALSRWASVSTYSCNSLCNRIRPQAWNKLHVPPWSSARPGPDSEGHLDAAIEERYLDLGTKHVAMHACQHRGRWSTYSTCFLVCTSTTHSRAEASLQPEGQRGAQQPEKPAWSTATRGWSAPSTSRRTGATYSKSSFLHAAEQDDIQLRDQVHGDARR
jgi:hypothetical protein